MCVSTCSVHVGILVWECMYTYALEAREEDIPGVFFYHSLPYVLKQDLSLGPKACHFG